VMIYLSVHIGDHLAGGVDNDEVERMSHHKATQEE
jgi:hypothetical protein